MSKRNGDRDLIRVEEFKDGDALVVRAEMPGIDPEKDVDVCVSDGMLRLRAERRDESETKDRNFTRKEFRYGSFARSIALPPGVDDDDITAQYKDGILEVRVAMPHELPTAERHVAITRG